MSNFFIFILALIVPLLFLSIIFKFDFYQTGQFHFILICFCWGAVAYQLASIINSTLDRFDIVGWENIVHINAPLLEELLKGLVLIYFVQRSHFTYSVDGAVYGFATGIGFAVFENFGALNSQTIAAILQRVFSANLIHASSSAIIGIALGIFLLSKARSRWLFLIAGLFFAIGQHILYNSISHGGTSLFAAFVTGILGTAFIALVMQYSKNQARNWIKEKLGMDDRVTRGEIAVIDRLPGPSNVLFPVFERFGADTADRVEELLYLQARIGIKRKSLDSFQANDRMRKKVETEVREMQADMEKVRKSVGVYPMLFVRGLFTEEMLSVWDRMQTKVQERSAATGGQKGGGLWSSLEERVQSPLKNGRVD